MGVCVRNLAKFAGVTVAALYLCGTVLPGGNQAGKLRKELTSPFKKWVDEDVAYIITDEERKAFQNLGTDEEREQFVEQFWLRRDPTPETEENEYKEEHYRR